MAQTMAAVPVPMTTKSSSISILLFDQRSWSYYGFQRRHQKDLFSASCPLESILDHSTLAFSNGDNHGPQRAPRYVFNAPSRRGKPPAEHEEHRKIGKAPGGEGGGRECQKYGGA